MEEFVRSYRDSQHIRRSFGFLQNTILTSKNNGNNVRKCVGIFYFKHINNEKN